MGKVGGGGGEVVKGPNLIIFHGETTRKYFMIELNLFKRIFESEEKKGNIHFVLPN